MYYKVQQETTFGNKFWYAYYKPRFFWWWTKVPESRSKTHTQAEVIARTFEIKREVVDVAYYDIYKPITKYYLGWIS